MSIVRVPVEPLREEFLHQQHRDGLTAGDLARLCDWETTPGKPDAGRVTRTLGLRCDCRTGARQATVREDVALRLARALHLYPRDVGL